MSDRGPIYDIELLKSLPLDGGSMRQALPNRHDLELTRKHNDRVAAGFEVLTEHYRRAIAEIERLRAIVDRLPKDEAGEPIAPGDVLYDGYKNGAIKVTGFDTRDGKLTCLIFRKGWDAICSGYYHDRVAAEKAREQ